MGVGLSGNARRAGTGLSGNQVFEKFRGRPPSADALIRHAGEWAPPHRTTSDYPLIDATPSYPLIGSGQPLPCLSLPSPSP